jgi:UDP-N-acetylmuramoyl-tripeptide--D-alanyl-D-alanine ligase
MSIARIITYQIYLLQQENYELKRFLLAVWTKTINFKSLTFRQEIIWTNKLKLVVGLALGILVVEQITFVSWLGSPGWIWLLLKLPFLFIGLCLYLSISTLILTPLDVWQKNKIIQSGVQSLKKWKSKDPDNHKIIAIAGSYGKSSVKNALEVILGQKFNVLATVGNENTPIGISRLLSTQLSDKTQVVILELGEYVNGDIKEMCEYYKPDFGVITGINEAHLERMGGINNTIKSIFELVENLPKGANIYLNKDDTRVFENYQKFCSNLETNFYAIENIKAEFNTEKLRYTGEGFELNMLAKYGFGLVDLGIQFGSKLGMTKDQISKGINEMKPVPHRLEAIKGQNGTLVIDDSYNGNPEGVRAAIEVLDLFKKENKKIVYCTPGLVEIGESSVEIHYQLGKELAEVVDTLILVKNQNTESMAKGYNEIKPNEVVKFYNSGPEMHSKFGAMLKGGEVILFQNDLTDNY